MSKNPIEHITHKHHRKHIISTNIVIVVVSLMIISYFSYVIINAETQYKILLDERTSEFNDQLLDVSGMLTKRINTTKTELNSEIDLLETILEATRRDNQEKITKLSGLIVDVEKKTDVQFTELKGELKKIDIKSADFSAIAQDALNSVVSITTDKGQGSGVLIREDGYIITNYHVIKDIKAAKVLTFDGKFHNTGLVGQKTEIDIAIIKIEGTFEYMDLGNSDNVRVGEGVIALGSPAGLDFSVTEGIVSAPNRIAPDGLGYIQTDVPINPGNSGGPLVDKSGKIVGINKFKIAGLEGLGFAIPANKVKEAINEIIP